MTRDTDGIPTRLTVLAALEAWVARFTAIWKWRHGDSEDFPDNEPDDTFWARLIARKGWVLAALAALLAVAVIWGLFACCRPGPGGTAKPSVRLVAAPVAKHHPASGEMDRRMPDGYRILLARSIFARDGAPAAKDATTTSGKLVLKGVTQEDDRFTAYVGAAGRVMQLHVGDALAMGNIRRITLHSIEYEAQGRLTRVEIGQPFDAGAAVSGSSLAAESTEASRPAASPPNGPPADAIPAPDHHREMPQFAGEPAR